MEKDLGVIIINDSLSSLVQIVEVINKSFRMLGYINRNVSYKKRGYSKTVLCLCQATCRVLCASLVSSICKGLLAFGES